MAKKKSTALVVYANEINLIPLKGMSLVENNVFFALLYKLKNQGTDAVMLEFAELKQLIDFQQNSDYIRQTINDIAEKIARSIVKFVDDETTKFFTLFQVLEIPNKDDFYIKAKISEPFVFALNKIESSFTEFELAEFSSLSSKYTQCIYRILKQYRRTGFVAKNWDSFCEFLDIPKTYAMRDIEKQILKPAIKELTAPRTIFTQQKPCFNKLTYKKIRGTGRGRPVEKIEFYFMPETKDPKEQKQNEEALQYIAQDIRQEQMLKKLKRSSKEPKKINPITGQQITGLENYAYRNMRFKNKFGEHDILKIQSIEQEPNGKIIVNLRNVDDNHTSTMKFDSLKHFVNFFEKNKM